MILARSPLRLSLGGGGTDLPSYYRRRGGYLIAGALDQFVTVSVSLGPQGAPPAGSEIIRAAHPLLDETLRHFGIDRDAVTVASRGDQPPGSGLGSSGSFTTAAIAALAAHSGRVMTPDEIAQLACAIEIDSLGRGVGKQDQYAAAHGGLRCYTFHPDDTVEVVPLRMSADVQHRFSESLMLYFTGVTRSAATLLDDQDARTRADDRTMLDNLDAVKAIGLDSRRLLEAGALSDYGALMHHHWDLKKRRSDRASLPHVDAAYDLARQNGALGGKIVGAGGGGFLLLLAERPDQVRAALQTTGLREVRFGFHAHGTEVMAP